MTDKNHQPSIEDLIANDEEGSVRSKLDAKMQSIKQKEKELLVKKEASKSNIPYIDLFGFAIGPEALKALLGVRKFPSRIRCATLPWIAGSEALS